MFGYVRPILNRLNDEEKARYKSAYCGLCHTLGKRHGWLARFTLNYDFTFLAILLYGGEGETTSGCRRCPIHPFSKPVSCICGRTLELAADESVILTWHKLGDDVADKGVIAGLPARFLRLLYGRAYRRAAETLPQFNGRVTEQMERLDELEKTGSPHLDRAADTFASILAAAAGDWGGDEARARVMKELLYHLGRWVYLTDAWDDLEDDRRKGRYNPLDARFHGQAHSEKTYVETTMTHSIRLAGAAANLLEFGQWGAIVDHVILSGLPAVQRAVLDGKWKEIRNSRENRK